MAWRRIALVVALSGAGLATAWAASPPMDFALGQNAEGQACRAQARFGGPPGARQSDVYCGEWERPSGRLTVMPLARRAEAEAILRRDCEGAATALQSSDFSEFGQIACATSGAQQIVPRYGLIAVRGEQVIVGASYPADWSALVNTGRVMTGAASAAAAREETGATPGFREIQAVFPSGAPGLSAASNYELLRRRAYEKNAVWNFGGSQTDFSELLALHRSVAPQDTAGEAELLAELALNLSGEERFDEARDTLDQARALATRAGDRLLLSKIENYRALDLMNQRQYAQAREAALAANAMRGGMSGPRGPGVITAGDVAAAETRGVRSRTSALLFSMGEMTEADRSAILSAQGSYIAGTAAHALHQQDAERHLSEASLRLAGLQSAPAWLKALIHQQMALTRIERGEASAAVALANLGIQEIRTTAPSTRTEAHLLLTLGKAQRRLGQRDQALANERVAVAIFAGQRERPGMPGDIASDYLGGLVDAWTASRDPAIGAEYLQVMSLVWDGAAARSATQLAARLAAREAGAEARRYQDAERAYRAALARRQRISIAAGQQDQALVAAAETEVRTSSEALQQAEAALRARSPRFLELLGPQVTAADLQGVLQPGEAYVRLVVTSSGGYGALVTREGVTPYRIALNSGQADLMAEQVRASGRLQRRRLRDFDVASAWRLYSGLFGPVDAQIAQASSLQVDVGGVLAGLPMSALVTAEPTEVVIGQIQNDQDYSSVQWLARRTPVAQSVGPAAFVRIRRAAAEQAPAGQAAIFGNFTPSPQAMAARLAQTRGLSERCRQDVERAIASLGALPDTATEAQQVAAMFGAGANVRLGGSFTDQAFMTAPDVTQAQVIVLATHGVLSLSNCLAEPALLASLGPDGDGLIDASELLDRRLHARLVVLSACDTAGGGRTDVSRSGLSGGGGEALSGLARGFLYAGASSVLATQWKVDSATSATEVMAFFESALRSGSTLSVALQQAQRRVYENEETGHPFYWAAYSLIGDGGARLTS